MSNMSGQQDLTDGGQRGNAPPPVSGAAREQMVSYYLADRESEFTQVQEFRVCAATWNVNGKSPCDSVIEWLATDQEPPDIYAIGFQVKILFHICTSSFSRFLLYLWEDSTFLRICLLSCLDEFETLEADDNDNNDVICFRNWIWRPKLTSPLQVSRKRNGGGSSVSPFTPKNNTKKSDSYVWWG